MAMGEKKAAGDSEKGKRRGKQVWILFLVAAATLLTAFGVDARSVLFFRGPASSDDDSRKVEYVNYESDGNRHKSLNGDPQIVVSGVNGGVSGIVIELGKPLDRDYPIQVYYADKNGRFTDERSRAFQGDSGSERIALPFLCAAPGFRIDIGTDPGIELDITSVTVKPSKDRAGLFGEILASGVFWVRAELLFLVFLFIGLHGIIGRKKLYDFIYRYRWYLGIGLIVLLTVNKIHGDSIAAYDAYIQSGRGSEFVYPLFGEARSIRSDDWMTDVGKRLSARFLENPFGKYNMVIRGTETVNPMYVGIKNAGQIGYSFFRIFYRIFGFEYGFCLEWNATAILTVLFTFEFFLILTKRKKRLSLLGTALVVFSSFHLWWVIPSFLLYIHAAIVFFYYFFTTDRKRMRVLCAIGEPVAAANFICIMYPAWQVPVAYMTLVFLAWVIHDNWTHIKNQKKDTWILFFAALFACVLFVGLYLHSITDRLDGVLTTVYPGKRISVGGEGCSKIFYYVQAFLYPFKAIANVPEAGTFCSLFPLPFFVAFVYLLKSRKRNWLIGGLFGVGLILSIYVYIGFPLWLSKLTMLSYSPSGRTADVVSLICVYLLILLLSEKEEKPWGIRWPLGLLISGITVACAVYVCRKNCPGYMPLWYAAGVSVILTLFGMGILSRIHDRLYRPVIMGVILLSAVSGISVRPFQRGLDAIDSKPAAGEIRAINKENPGKKWIAVGKNAVLPAYCIANGAPTINSINDYPNLELWNKLDQREQYNEVYNRYAHVVVDFCDGETSFELIQDDMFMLHLSYRDLRLTEAAYVVADHALSVNNARVFFEKLYGESGIYIYRIHYR